MSVDRVAVIGGTGAEGFGLALRWASAGLEVVIGSRDQSRAEDAAARLRGRVAEAQVSGLVNAEAASRCSTVVVAVPFSGQAAIYKSLASGLGPDNVVVDCTVPVEAAVGGKATHVLGVWEGSAAQLATSLIPEGTTLCAAFHTLSASAL